MGIIKDGVGLLVGVPLVGATLGAIGTNMTGALSGIGNATQSLVAGGFLGHTAKTTLKFFK